MKLVLPLETVTRRMARSLVDAARKAGVSLEGLSYENHRDFLSAAFKDAGYTCEDAFTDFAWDYAVQFGLLGTADFEKARQEAIAAAIPVTLALWNNSSNGESSLK